MNFSSMFQNIKHNGYTPTEKELSGLREFLNQKLSKYFPESHSAIHILGMFSTSRREDVDILRRFLDDDADDYARAAAIQNIIWRIGVVDAKIKGFIEDVLRGVDIERFAETIPKAFSAALFLAKRPEDAEMIIFARSAYETVLGNYESGRTEFGGCLTTLFNSVAIEEKARGAELSLAKSAADAAVRSDGVLRYFDRIAAMAPSSRH